jgi:hypothetical protein
MQSLDFGVMINPNSSPNPLCSHGCPPYCDPAFVAGICGWIGKNWSRTWTVHGVSFKVPGHGPSRAALKFACAQNLTNARRFWRASFRGGTCAFQACAPTMPACGGFKPRVHQSRGKNNLRSSTRCLSTSSRTGRPPDWDNRRELFQPALVRSDHRTGRRTTTIRVRSHAVAGYIVQFE